MRRILRVAVAPILCALLRPGSWAARPSHEDDQSASGCREVESHNQIMDKADYYYLLLEAENALMHGERERARALPRARQGRPETRTSSGRSRSYTSRRAISRRR